MPDTRAWGVEMMGVPTQPLPQTSQQACRGHDSHCDREGRCDGAAQKYQPLLGQGAEVREGFSEEMAGNESMAHPQEPAAP